MWVVVYMYFQTLAIYGTRRGIYSRGKGQRRFSTRRGFLEHDLLPRTIFT